MRAKPTVVGCRLTKDKKQLFEARARSEGKTIQQVLEALIDSYLEGET